MKQIIWTKVFLTIYKRINRIIEEMDNARDGLVRCGFGGGYNRGLSNEELFEKIIKLNYRRLGLINVKVLVDEGLRRLPQSVREILEARYFEEDLEGYQNRHGICKRTVFKRLDKATYLLSEVFIKLGYDEKKMNLEYKDEPLLTKVGKRLEILYYSKSS